MDFVTLGLAAAKYVVPYLVKLKDNTAEAAGKKAGEIVVDKALEGAKGVWHQLTDWYKDDQKFITLSEFLKSDPKDEDSQQKVAKELAMRLEKEPVKAEQLQKLLGGAAAVNSLVVGEKAVVEKIRQNIKGSGQNVINVATEGKATDVEQDITN